MLIRINGGAGGIKEYLEDGQKQDRFYSRDELDERVILDGNLSVTDAIIESMATDKNKYFHITLAFKENHIAPEVLENINHEFKEYFLTGYSENEINYYAETHLPKIKSYVSSSDGQLIERKPHIHIIIPRTNLLDGASFNPSIPKVIKYINAFQEHINAKYGLESPKDNLRTSINDTSEVISRHKGGIFAAKGREQKSNILNLIFEHNPMDMDSLKMLLAQQGYAVKIRNKTDANASYLNVKLPDDAKGLNLKDSVFLDEFLGLPLEVKLAKLNAPKLNTYIQQTVPRETELIHKQSMQEWREIKALEMRFISRGTSKYERIAYYKLSKDNKIIHLKNKQYKHYAQYNIFLESNKNGRNNEPTASDIINLVRSNESIINDLETDTTRIGSLEIGNNRTSIRESIIKRSKERYRAHSDRSQTNEQNTIKNSVVTELMQQNHEDNRQQTFKNYLRELNTSIHADVLLELTERTHGIQPELYFITKARHGSDRIGCGKRNLSLVDFCTQELHLSFKATIKLLDNVYHMQNDLHRARGWSIKHDIYLREQYKEWLRSYKSDRSKNLSRTSAYTNDERKLIITLTKNQIKIIRENKSLAPIKRAQQINILKAQQILNLRALTVAKQQEQQSIRETFNLEMQASYRKFLSEQAKLGDEIALEELRRLRIKFDQSQPHIDNTFIYVNRYQEFRLNITHDIDNEGNICYKLNNQIIIKDTGKKIKVIHDTTDNVKLTLELAMAKFGKTIELTGTAEFKRKAVEAAIKNNYKVEFLDEYAKQYHTAYLDKLQADTSKLKNNLAGFIQSKPDKCVITGIGICEIIDNYGRFKSVNIYTVRNIKDNKEFIITNRNLDYQQQQHKLDLNQIYDAKQSVHAIKLNRNNKTTLHKNLTNNTTAEDATISSLSK